MNRLRLGISVTCSLLSIGCTSSVHGPRLGALYDRAAQHHDEHRNPVILIPGLLGTKLVERRTARVAWGAFSGDYADPRTRDGARLIAFPMREGAELHELHHDVRTAGVLDAEVALNCPRSEIACGKKWLQYLRRLDEGGCQLAVGHPEREYAELRRLNEVPEGIP